MDNKTCKNCTGRRNIVLLLDLEAVHVLGKASRVDMVCVLHFLRASPGMESTDIQSTSKSRRVSPPSWGMSSLHLVRKIQ
jgi:hypothetical protein